MWLVVALLLGPAQISAPAIGTSSTTDVAPADAGAAQGTVTGEQPASPQQPAAQPSGQPVPPAPKPAPMSAPPVAEKPPAGPTVAPALVTAPSIPFELRVGGLLQIEYLGRATEGHLARRLMTMPAPLGPAPANPIPTPTLDESTLLLRRARLSAGGLVATPRLEYFTEMDAGEGQFALLEYWLRARLGHGLSLKVGQMRVPFSRSWSIREDRLVFIERSIATDQFRYDYDIGVVMEGSWVDDRLVLTLAGFNGGGRILAKNDNLDPMLVFRIEGRPTGMVSPAIQEGPPDAPEPAPITVGGSVSVDYDPTPPSYGYLSGDSQPPRQLVIDANGDGLPDGITVLQTEVDVTAALHRTALEAEAYYRYEGWHDIPPLQPGAPFQPKNSYWGLFLEAFQGVGHEWTLGGRFSFTQLSPLSPGYQRHGSSSCLAASGMTYACNLPYADEETEVSAVVAKKVIPEILQVSAMYSFLYWSSSSSPEPTDPIEQRLILAVQLAF
jgi:hypothetical protein